MNDFTIDARKVLSRFRYYDRRIVPNELQNYCLKFKQTKDFASYMTKCWKNKVDYLQGTKFLFTTFFLTTIQQFLACKCFNIAYHLDVELKSYEIIGYYRILIDQRMKWILFLAWYSKNNDISNDRIVEWSTFPLSYE